MTELEVLQKKKAEKLDICFENLCYDVKIKKKVGFLKSISNKLNFMHIFILQKVIER